MQLEHASRNHVTSNPWHGEPTFADQRANGLDRNPYQSVGFDGISHRAVIGLVLAEQGAEWYQSLLKQAPRGGPGGCIGWRFR